jgi:hypothetical protein
MSEEKPDKNMEALSRAIVDALLRAPEVRRAMERIAHSDEDHLGPESFMVMMLKVRNLAESLGIDVPADDEEREPKPDRVFDTDELTLKLSETGVDIDAFIDTVEAEEPPTDNETLFREFAAERFDEAAWLRKLRLIL